MSRPAPYGDVHVHVYSDPEQCLATDRDARLCVMPDNGQLTVYHVSPEPIGSSNHWWCLACGVTTGPDA